MSERLRCTQCKKLLDESDLVKHEKTEALELFAAGSDEPPNEYAETLLAQRFHRVMRSQYAGGGRIGCRTYREDCGPVELEQVEEYVLQFEHMIGEPT